MPEFTVIEGGGGRDAQGRRDYDADLAQQTLSTLAVELLRALARGDDREGRVSHAVAEFSRYASQTEKPLYQIVQKAVSELHTEALQYRVEEHESENEVRQILTAALRVTAESMASDNGAKGRRSKRLDALNSAIKERDVGREDRRRKVHGSTKVPPSKASRAPSSWDDIVPVWSKPRARTVGPGQGERPHGMPPPDAKREGAPTIAGTAEDAAYLAQLGVPIEELAQLAGGLNGQPATTQLHEIARALSKRTRRRISITDVRDSLIPALRRCTNPA